MKKFSSVFSFLLIIYLSFNYLLSYGDKFPKCPCSVQKECQLPNSNSHYLNMNQTIGYLFKSNQTVWSTFDWGKLTMIALVDFHQDQLMCLAHRNKVRIMSFANFTLGDVYSPERIEQWTENRLNEAKNHFYDGINLFIDDQVESNSTASNNITKLVKMVAKRFHQSLPGSVVLFSVPFSPYNKQKNGVDGKNYDYLSISKLVDSIVVMDFDQRSQSFDEPQCAAGASESLYVTIGGLMAYEQLGLDLTRVILTLGFYVDEYVCIEYHQNFRCIIQPYNYRGSNCSSKVANRIPWNVYKQMNKQCWRKIWDEHSDHDIYTSLDNSIYGIIRQYWSNYLGLPRRLGLIKQKNLTGIGAWMLNYLDKKTWDLLPLRTKT